MGIARTLAVLVVWWCLVGPAATYGGIWERHVHQLPGITIQFKDGSTLTGDLSRNFDQSWELLLPDGRSRLFTPTEWVAMSSSPNAQHSYFELWRSWLPVVALSALVIAVMSWPWISRMSRMNTRESDDF